MLHKGHTGYFKNIADQAHNALRNDKHRHLGSEELSAWDKVKDPLRSCPQAITGSDKHASDFRQETMLLLSKSVL